MYTLFLFRFVSKCNSFRLVRSMPFASGILGDWVGEPLMARDRNETGCRMWVLFVIATFIGNFYDSFLFQLAAGVGYGWHRRDHRNLLYLYYIIFFSCSAASNVCLFNKEVLGWMRKLFWRSWGVEILLVRRRKRDVDREERSYRWVGLNYTHICCDNYDYFVKF